jgi:hypothetical protein
MSKKTFSFDEAFQEQPKTFSFDEALEPSIGKQLLDSITPKPAGGVLEGTTLTPEELAAPATGPSLADAISSIKDTQAISPEAAGIEAADYGKLFGAGATRGTFAAPEAIERGTAGISRDTTFKPTEFLNYLSDPRKLTNDLAQAIRLPKVFEEDAALGVIPEETVAKQRAAVDEALTKGKIQSLRNLTDYGNKLSDRIVDSVTPEMKLALADSQPTGNIIEAFETGDFSKISLGKDASVAGLAGHTAQSVGSFAPALAARILTKSPVVGATFSFGQAGSEGVDEAREFVGKLTFDQLAKESPYFRNLLVLGYDPKTAKEMTIDKATDTAAYMQGIVGALGNEFTANLMTGKIGGALLANSRNKALQILGGTTTGMVEEGFQELAEGLATDLGINKAVVREMGVDSFANLVLGALGGAGPGAIGGALRRQEDAAPAQEPTLTDVRVPPTAPEGIDPELRARAAMRLEQILLDAQATNKINGRNLNKLARELGITPSKDVNDTKRAIYLAVTQNQPAAAPAVVPEAPVAQAPVTAPAPIAGEALTDADIEPDETPVEAQAPVVAPRAAAQPEIVQSFPMGENSEFRVIKSDQGYVTNLYDKDAEQYLDTMRLFPTETFGEEAEARAIEFARSESEKAAALTPQATEVVKEEEIKAEATSASKFAKEMAGILQGTDTRFPMGSDKVYNAEATLFNFARQNPNESLDIAKELISNSDLYSDQTGLPPGRIKSLGKQLINAFAEKEPAKTQAEINQERQAAQREAAKPTQEAVGRPTKPDGKPLELNEWWDYNKVTQEQLRTMPEDKYQAFRKKTADYYDSFEEPAAAEEAKPAEKPRDTGTEMYPFAKPEVKVSENKIFTEDAATKARNRLRSKLNQLNSGIDPEFLIDGITLSGYHIEKGARTFAAYSKAMIEDLGDKVKPYLKQWYNAVRDDPSAKELVDSMDTYDQVQKASLPGAEEGTMDLMNPDSKFKIAQAISQHFVTGNGFPTIVEARKFISNLTGKKIEAATADAKEADEAIEVGIVLAARKIAESGESKETIYNNLVDLYNRQPNLNVRSSTSIKEQAYSTPAPLAYIASQLAGIDKNTTVYEPTAGNGMLLIGANPKNVKANELNATRYEMLKKVLPDAEVVNKNALSYDPTLSDVIIANPPFGAIGEEVTVAGNKTREIDHAIAYKALGRMPVNGRAVLIVGGVRGETEDARKEGYRSAQKRTFYFNLYRDYNVVDHFTVDGDLYKKQGAAYPVDVIVIDGKGQSERSLPAAELPQVYSSYEQLKEKLDEASRMESRGVRSTAGVAGGEATVGTGEREGLDRGAVRPSEPTGTTREEPRAGGEPSVSEAGRATARPTEPARAKPSESQPGSFDVLERGNRGQEPVPFSGEGSQRGVGTDVQRRQPESLGGPSTVAGTRVESRLKDRRGLEEQTETQVTYDPFSEAPSVGTLMPAAMAQSIRNSLQLLVNQVGNIDDFVSKSLKISKEELFNGFSAEQVDALALSIQNASKGKGFIIGDQTGIGKGRVVAAMIKYALVSGRIPIFVTEKPNLYSDMIRDLDDIGMTKELGLDTAKPKVFITNSGQSVPYQLIRMQDGEPVEINLTLKSPKTGKDLDAMMKDMVQADSLGQYKVIFTTYSQLQTVKEKVTERAKFIKSFGEGNYMIFDESHNAGGAGETRGKEDGPENRAAFVRSLVNNAFGTFFSSATYAKRADVMDLYSSTNMSLAVDKPSMLGEAIKHGGVPMQQIVATMLTQDGQYIRRERTFKGVSYDTQETAVNKETAENMASAMREVLSFSRDKDVVLKQMQKEYDKEAKVVSEYGGGEKTTVQGANFGSIMHGLIDQMLLALKSQDSVKHAINRLKAGEKVVLTVSNTMGSFLKDYSTDMNIKMGEEVNLSFADLYIRYLDKQRTVKIKGPEGTQEYRLTDEDLGPTLTAKYERIRQQILDSGFGSAPISPIDYMHNELRKAGFKTEEITGRTITLNYASGKPVLQSRTANIKQRVGAVRSFNNGETDVIILNQAGSTGLSLHASDKFKDQSKRHMIIVQAEKNIDTHMQMLGRVHRTGQVIAPAYSQMMADIPAEMRPAAVLMKKMASLNANTTASRKSAVSAEGVVDFMNDYGGQVTMEYLADNPDVYESLGGEKLMNISEDEEAANEAAVRKFTGYIPILPIKQQEEVYEELVGRYNELLERENAMGTNKLEAKALPLNAETISREPVTKDKGADSIFSQPAYMERVEVDRTVKPFSKVEVLEMVDKNLDGKSRAEKNGEMRNSLQERTRAFVNEKVEKMKESETDPVKIENFKADMSAMYAKMKTVLDTYRLGDQVSIKDQNNIFTYGVITNITNAKKTANPSAGSDWKMQIALANGEARSLDINFSQIGTRFELKVVDEVNWLNPETNSGIYIPVLDIFDKGATVRREKRWMVTGNILGGFATYPGQIITYTKKDGTTGQGVLMSRQFDFEKAKKEAPVYLRTASDVILFLDKIGGEAGTDDNQLRIIKRGEQYQFITARSKRQGGKYFANDGITRHISFYSRGNDMVAGTFNQDVAETVINYILNVNEMNENIVAKTGVSQAREVFAPKLSQEEINQIRQADKAREGGDFYNNFAQDINEKDITNNIPVVREENIREYAELRKAGRRLLEQVAKYGSTVPLQRQLNQMLAQEQNLKQEIALTKPIKNTAADFMARATKALADGEITPDVEAFIRRMYEKQPTLLEGLRLSIKENKTDGKAIGNFAPYKRMVTLWRHTAGVTDPSTARHEIMHSLEQMMTPDARDAVITEWAKSLERAMRENVDPRSRDYFDAVLVFLANPTKANFDAATNKLPSYKFYQYINPSEYWAINAEKLMAAKLGTPWQRFVNGVKALIEGLKRFFGFNNKYAIHQAFNAILKGEQVRKTQDMLVDYIADGKYEIKFMNNIQDDQNLVDKYDMPEVPGHDPRTFKEMMIGSWDSLIRDAEEWHQSSDKFSKTIGKAWNQATKLRIETAWFAAGLDEADFKRHEGKIRTENNKAIAAMAVRNYMKAGYISTDVLKKGRLEYSSRLGVFQAVESDKSIGNIIIAQAELRKKLGRQLADQIFQGYAVAHRTREIQNAYLDATNEVETLKQELQNTFEPLEKQKIAGELESAQRELKNIRIAYEKAPAFLCVLDEKKPYVEKDGKRIPNVKYGPDELPILNDEAIDEFIAKDKDYPIMEEMLDNWRPVNHNMLDNLVFSGKISKREADRYKKHKYYVPWTRIMDEEESIYDSSKMSANRAGIKYFKAGRTERDIDNVVESMINNVVMMTRMSIQNYAINRVAEDYGERLMIKDQKTGEMKPGRLKAYPTTGIDDTGVRIPITINGNKRIVKIPDHMVADAVLGMFIPTPDNKFTRFMSTMANLTRRSVTFSLYFQAKQVVKDAPTAAWVSGVKSPLRVTAGTIADFGKALGNEAEVAQIIDEMQSIGVGGFRSFHRDEKKERAIELGLLEDKTYVKALKFIDKFGDSSDLAPRVAIYKRVLKESGDPALAMLQASEIVDWQKHGKSRTALFLRSNVPFLQAYATTMDAFMQAAQGKGFKGKKQSEALKQFYIKTGLTFAAIGLMYAFAAASDDDYWELDDATRARNLYIPYSKKMFGRHVIFPMNTTAAIFWKFLPELAYTYVISQNTKREIDKTRASKMMFDVFTDTMLGPTPVPSVIKTTGEIALDLNTFTGGNVTPKSLKDVDAVEQYNASTSELGKMISSLTGTDKKRLLNPIEADHLIRGIFGTIGSSTMWASNQVFNENRTATQLKENPLTGGIFVPDVQRLRENLLYDLRDRTQGYQKTLTTLEGRDMKKAGEYFKEHKIKIQGYERASEAARDLADINKEIRMINDSKDTTKWTPESKRARINELGEQKNRMLANVIKWRKDAGL